MRVKNSGGIFWQYISNKCYYIGQGIIDVPVDVARYLLEHYSYIQAIDELPKIEERPRPPFPPIPPEPSIPPDLPIPSEPSIPPEPPIPSEPFESPKKGRGRPRKI